MQGGLALDRENTKCFGKGRRDNGAIEYSQISYGVFKAGQYFLRLGARGNRALAECLEVF
jgi:hypothetical protein